MSVIRLLFGKKPARFTRISPGAALPAGVPRPDMFDFTPIDKAMFDELTSGTALAADNSHGQLWVLCAPVVFVHPDGSTHHPLVAEVPDHGHWLLGQPIPIDVYEILVHNKRYYHLKP